MAKRRTARTGDAKAGEKTGPREIELKLSADPSDVDEIDRCIRALADGDRVREQMLRSAYFDTHDLELRAAGLSFRIRADGDRRRRIEGAGLARPACPPPARARLRGANTPAERAALLAELSGRSARGG